MFGPDFSTAPAAVTAVAPVPVRSPPPQRVVEDTAQPQLSHQETGTLLSPPAADLRRLSASAREFADLLDKTGDVQIASAISGFRRGHFDMYV
jgi:hypothetical protein